MNTQQPSEMQSNVATAQMTPADIPEQNVRYVQPGQNVYVVPVIQQQQQPYVTEQQPAALSQAQGMSSGTRRARPKADQNAFMGTDTEGRFASYDDITPAQRAKQLEAEMKDKYKYRKEQRIPPPVKRVSIGGKPIDIDDEQQ